jgi:hypothetical protein
MKQESVMPYNNIEKENIILAEDMTTSLKIIVHMAYDLCFVKDAWNLTFSKTEIQPLNELINSLENHDFQNLKNEAHQDYPIQTSGNIFTHEKTEKARALHSLDMMLLEYGRLEENIKKIRL